MTRPGDGAGEGGWGFRRREGKEQGEAGRGKCMDLLGHKWICLDTIECFNEPKCIAQRSFIQDMSPEYLKFLLHQRDTTVVSVERVCPSCF